MQKYKYRSIKLTIIMKKENLVKQIQSKLNLKIISHMIQD